jgi:hypothetical protein
MAVLLYFSRVQSEVDAFLCTIFMVTNKDLWANDAIVDHLRQDADI